MSKVTIRDVLLLIILILFCAFFPSTKTNKNLLNSVVFQKHVYIEVEHTLAPFFKAASDMIFDDFTYGYYTINAVVVYDKKIPKLLSVFDKTPSDFTKHKDRGKIIIRSFFDTGGAREATIQLDYQTFLYMSKSSSKKFLLLGEKDGPETSVCSVYLEKE